VPNSGTWPSSASRRSRRAAPVIIRRSHATQRSAVAGVPGHHHGLGRGQRPQPDPATDRRTAVGTPRPAGSAPAAGHRCRSARAAAGGVRRRTRPHPHRPGSGHRPRGAGPGAAQQRRHRHPVHRRGDRRCDRRRAILRLGGAGLVRGPGHHRPFADSNEDRSARRQLGHRRAAVCHHGADRRPAGGRDRGSRRPVRPVRRRGRRGPRRYLDGAARGVPGRGPRCDLPDEIDQAVAAELGTLLARWLGQRWPLYRTPPAHLAAIGGGDTTEGEKP